MDLDLLQDFSALRKTPDIKVNVYTPSNTAGRGKEGPPFGLASEISHVVAPLPHPVLGVRLKKGSGVTKYENSTEIRNVN